jgi:hypothetical protein
LRLRSQNVNDEAGKFREIDDAENQISGNAVTMAPRLG